MYTMCYHLMLWKSSACSRQVCAMRWKNCAGTIILKPGDRVLDSGTGSDLPSQWTDTFSLVNQHFLTGALTGPQWEVSLEELRRVIAPGGWVQLVEGVTMSRPTGLFSVKISNLWSALTAHRGLLADSMERLPDMLTQAGFANVWSETRALPLGQWADFRDDLASVLSAMRGPLFEGGGLGLVSSEQENDDLIACVTKEWNNGQEVSPSAELVVMYAQKHDICKPRHPEAAA
ncbi:hypothetical protein ARMGADRAFT_1096483 [Armillaria gallica]|uniref:Methyltransferase type 11 domain-containing protein n=1 Tax=Armillaria gallica TaxID=47427 RepID=A0A2H3EP24_ARMGA|nr:hypothetical protein ARMGADRAFT_1096483 [Armillaria gallica]